MKIKTIAWATLLLCSLSTSIVFAQTKVGISAPLTGPLAEYGAAIVHGLDIAKQEYAKQKNQVEFILEDNLFDSSTSISVFKTFTGPKKVKALYSWGEPVLYATAAMIEKEKLPSYTLSNDDIPARDKASILNLQVPPEDYAKLMLDQLRKRGFKTFGIIVAQDLFTEAMARGFRAKLKADEKLVIDEQILPDSTDFRSLIAKISLKKNIDALGVYLQVGQVGLFARDARKAGINAQLFGVDSFESKSEFELSTGALAGGIFTNFKVPADFQRKVSTLFPSETKHSFVWHSYIFAIASFEALKPENVTSAKTTNDAYREAFKKLNLEEKISPKNMRYLAMPIALRLVTKAGEFEDLD